LVADGVGRERREETVRIRRGVGVGGRGARDRFDELVPVLERLERMGESVEDASGGEDLLVVVRATITEPEVGREALDDGLGRVHGTEDVKPWPS